VESEGEGETGTGWIKIDRMIADDDYDFDF
jgi:hypothetical protein